MNKIKVGVVGVGHLGRFHAQKYSQISEAELVGVTDLDKERAKKVADECGCDLFKDVDSLLRNVDAVSIVVPTDRHFEVGKEALIKGIHCIVEKPIAQTVEQADRLIKTAKESGAILHVGHVERFNPAIRSLEGVEINPRFVESHRLASFNPRGTEVAVVLDLMIHDIDVVMNMVKSPVVNIDASGVAVVSDSIDIANARIRFKNGCVANLTASRISQKSMRKMRLFQKDAYIGVDFLEKKSEVYQLEEVEHEIGTVLGEIGVGERKRKIVYRSPDIPEGDGLLNELESFILTLQGKRTKFVSGEEGKDALSVAIEILKKLEV